MGSKNVAPKIMAYKGGINNDMNTALEAGIFKIAGKITNGPDGVSEYYGTLESVYAGDDLFVQRLSNGFASYERRFSSNSFGPWYRYSFSAKTEAELASVVAGSLTAFKSTTLSGVNLDTITEPNNVVKVYIVLNSCTSLPTGSSDGIMLSFGWSSSKYSAQLFFNANHGLHVRTINNAQGTSWSSWLKI